jgi:hypothetical protein
MTQAEGIEDSLFLFSFGPDSAVPRFLLNAVIYVSVGPLSGGHLTNCGEGWS